MPPAAKDDPTPRVVAWDKRRPVPQEFRLHPLTELHPEMDADEFASLDSIGTSGLQTPFEVVGDEHGVYSVVLGRHRYLKLKALDIKIEPKHVNVLVGEWTEKMLMQRVLISEQRRKPNPRYTCSKVLDWRPDWSPSSRELAEFVGCSKSLADYVLQERRGQAGALSTGGQSGEQIQGEEPLQSAEVEVEGRDGRRQRVSSERRSEAARRRQPMSPEQRDQAKHRRELRKAEREAVEALQDKSDKDNIAEAVRYVETACDELHRLEERDDLHASICQVREREPEWSELTRYVELLYALRSRATALIATWNANEDTEEAYQ